MIVPLPTLLADASEGGYAVGYFEAWDSYSLEAVVEALARLGVPEKPVRLVAAGSALVVADQPSVRLGDDR